MLMRFRNSDDDSKIFLIVVVLIFLCSVSIFVGCDSSPTRCDSPLCMICNRTSCRSDLLPAMIYSVEKTKSNYIYKVLFLHGETFVSEKFILNEKSYLVGTFGGYIPNRNEFFQIRGNKRLNDASIKLLMEASCIGRKMDAPKSLDELTDFESQLIQHLRRRETTGTCE